MRHFLKLTLDDAWFRILLWVIGISALTLIVPYAFLGLYDDPTERELLRETLDNPALIAMVGPVPEGAYTIAIMFSHEMLVFMGVIHGLFGVMIANSVSRKMEDRGLIEYVNSAGITRQSIFMTQLLIGAGMNALLGLVLFAGLSLSPDDSFTFAGSAMYALGTSLFGLGVRGFTFRPAPPVSLPCDYGCRKSGPVRRITIQLADTARAVCGQ